MMPRPETGTLSRPPGFKANHLKGLAVPRFYFPTHDGSKLIVDEDGTELADEAAARREAVKSLCELATDRFPAAEGEAALRLDVLDSSGKPLFEVCLALSLPKPKLPG